LNSEFFLSINNANYRSKFINATRFCYLVFLFYSLFFQSIYSLLLANIDLILCLLSYDAICGRICGTFITIVYRGLSLLLLAFQVNGNAICQTCLLVTGIEVYSDNEIIAIEFAYYIDAKLTRAHRRRDQLIVISIKSKTN